VARLGGARANDSFKPRAAAGWDRAADLEKDPALVPERAETDVPAELRAEIERQMAKYPRRQSAVLAALRAAQRVHGYLSHEAIVQVAAVMGVTPAYLSSIASFYDMLNEEPVGRRYVYVCTSVSCHLRGAKEMYDAIAAAGATLSDVNIREVECLGACDMAPMASIDGRFVGPLEQGDVRQLVADLSSGRAPLPGRGLSDSDFRLPWNADEASSARDGEHRLLLEDIDTPGLATLAIYERRGGYKALRKALKLGPEKLLRELEASGLRGRGGAGFSMGKKASFIPKGTMDKYLCANADESEPGTFKDRLLMQKDPHRLIEGIIIAAAAAGANRAFIYIRGEYEYQAGILDRAVAEAYRKGYLGDRILGSDHSLELVVHRGAGAYICGEESALLDSLEGERGNPRLKPPFPALQGLYQGPTLINNVETLANVPLVIEKGADSFRSLGTERSPGTKVVSVSGNVRRPGNYEVEMGIPAREIVYGLAGGPPPGRSVKCWFPGGSSAPVLLERDLDLPYDFETMAEAGSMLGSGGIIVVDDSVPIVSVALRLAKFYRHESCGKCTPCREGTNWTVKMLERVDSGEATPMDLEIVAQVQQNIIGNCLCVLGDSMAMPVGSMVEKFRDEFERHIELARERADVALAESAVELAPSTALGPA